MEDWEDSEDRRLNNLRVFSALSGFESLSLRHIVFNKLQTTQTITWGMVGNGGKASARAATSPMRKPTKATNGAGPGRDVPAPSVHVEPSRDSSGV